MPKRPVGRPPGIHTKFVVNDPWDANVASMIEALSGRGRSIKEIAQLIGRQVRNIQTTYKKELQLGGIKATAKLEQTAHELANGRAALYDKDGRLMFAEVKPREAMVRFLLLTKCGYRLPTNTPAEDGGIQPTGPLLGADPNEKNELVIKVEGGLPPRPPADPLPDEPGSLAESIDDAEGGDL